MSMRVLTLFASLISLVWACSSEPAPPERDAATRDVIADADLGGPDVTDAVIADARSDLGETASMCPPDDGAFSAACASDADCDRGLCLADGDSGICTDFCLDACPSFCDGRRTFCRGIESNGSVAFVCAPELDVS